MPARRRRGGWRTHKGRIEAYVRLYAGTGGLKTRQFPIGTRDAVLQEWIDHTYYDHRKTHPRGVAGTLARDVETYLPLLADRPRLQQARQFELAWWCAQFGHRARWSLQPVELDAALTGLLAEDYAASTVNKYRTALYHLFSRLDGKRADNPLRDVPRRREPDPLPKAIPYDVIDAIFDAMPAIPAKPFLQVMAYTGLPPALIRTIEVRDYNPADASLLARGRKKGGGVRPRRLPLTPRGIEAVQAFLEAGRPNVPKWDQRRALRKAITTLCATLEADPKTAKAGAALRLELATCTPYTLRHSFLTEVQLATGNIHATQHMGLHADAKTTQRYTLAAVAPELQAVAAVLAGRRVGAARTVPNQVPMNGDPTGAETSRKRPVRKPRLRLQKSAKRETKPRKIV
jgi:integrase